MSLGPNSLFIAMREEVIFDTIRELVTPPRPKKQPIGFVPTREADN